MKDPVESNSEQPRSRLEDEVLEILQRADREPSNVVRLSDAMRHRQRGLSRRFGEARFAISLTSTNLLIACVGLALVAVLVKDASPLAARLLGIASVIALVTLFVRAYVRPESSRTKRWRGRDIDLSSPSVPEWFDRRFRRPKGPRR